MQVVTVDDVNLANIDRHIALAEQAMQATAMEAA
jgi:hypothetical protein